MKVLLDTNIILDFFLARFPFVNEAVTLWDANRKGLFEGYVSAITPVNLYYIGKKLKGANQAHQAVTLLLSEFQVCLVDKGILQRATLSSIKDYEDAVQYESAIASGVEAIVTRDLKDYSSVNLPVFSPADFVKNLPTPKKTL
jgi:predicted nucleic acid-binding protein